MATYDLMMGTASPEAKSAHFGPSMETMEVVLDAKYLAAKTHNPISIGAADILQLVRMPQSCVVYAAKYEVSVVNGAAATIEVEWGSDNSELWGTTGVDAIDTNAIGSGIKVLDKIINTAGETLIVVANSALTNARIKLQLVVAPFVLDDINSLGVI